MQTLGPRCKAQGRQSRFSVKLSVPASAVHMAYHDPDSPFVTGRWPDDILEVILAKIVDGGRPSDVASASQTCKAWYNIISELARRQLQALAESSFAAHGPRLLSAST